MITIKVSGNDVRKYEVEVYGLTWHEAHPEFGPMNLRYTNDDGQVVEVDPTEVWTYDHSHHNIIRALWWVMAQEIGMRAATAALEGHPERIAAMRAIKHPHSPAFDDIA